MIQGHLQLGAASLPPGCRVRLPCLRGKIARSPPACRHQDMAYWPPFTSDTATASCWLAVSEATVENGCMRFVAGSHAEAELRPHAPGAPLPACSSQ